VGQLYSEMKLPACITSSLIYKAQSDSWPKTKIQNFGAD